MSTPPSKHHVHEIAASLRSTSEWVDFYGWEALNATQTPAPSSHGANQPGRATTIPDPTGNTAANGIDRSAGLVEKQTILANALTTAFEASWIVVKTIGEIRDSLTPKDDVEPDDPDATCIEGCTGPRQRGGRCNYCYNWLVTHPHADGGRRSQVDPEVVRKRKAVLAQRRAEERQAGLDAAIAAAEADLGDGESEVA